MICCLTAYSESHYKVTAKQSGMDFILVKPIFKSAAQKLLSKAGLF